MRGYSLEERFWAKVVRLGDDDCWEWTAFRNPAGYGMIGIDGVGTVRLAHRVAWQMAYGEIPAGMCVMHSCDNPACVNRAHLSLGTIADNNRDRHAKGRDGGVRGEDSPHAKLSDVAVHNIMVLRKEGLSYTEIAAAIGVTKATIYKVTKGRSWSHVSGVPKFVP